MIEVKIDKAKLEKGLKDLAQKTSNLRPVMRAISEDMMYAVKQNFETEGSRLGKKWADLAPSTQEARKKRGYGSTAPKLQQERKLYDSITSYADDNTAVVGSNLPYARLHQFGGDIKNPGGVKFIILKGKFIPMKKDAKRYMGITKPFKFKVPARPFLGLNESDMDSIQNTIVKYLNVSK